MKGGGEGDFSKCGDGQQDRGQASVYIKVSNRKEGTVGRKHIKK